MIKSRLNLGYQNTIPLKDNSVKDEAIQKEVLSERTIPFFHVKW